MVWYVERSPRPSNIAARACPLAWPHTHPIMAPQLPSLRFALTVIAGTLLFASATVAQSPYDARGDDRDPGPTVLTQPIDNKGDDFITSFNPNPIDGPPIVEIHLTADTPTNVTVQYPVNTPTFNTTVAVGPGAITVVQLPSAASVGWTVNAISNNAVRMFAPLEFVAYTVNRLTFTSDAALALPIEALNTDYIVTTYSTSPGQLTVVAAFDDTQVTITPSQAMTGRPAGVPFMVTLNRGEGYFGQASIGDLTGTIISANKPVAMTNGNRCATVPAGVGFCDHIYQVAQPVASWGTSALAAPLANRPNGSIYRVLAAEDNTTVERNGSVIGTLNRGQFHETDIVPGPQVFSADKPIFVTQFMTGVNAPGAVLGDPAMSNVIPSEQFLSAYTFSTISGAFAQHFLSVIAENTDVTEGTILLDGVAIPAGDFSPIGATQFSHATVALSDGTHTTASGGRHGITVAGYNTANSYIYPGGAQFQFINPGQDETPPVCSGQLNGDVFFGQVTDLLSDDPENRGVFFVTLAQGATNLSLAVDPFVPGAEVVTFQVTKTNPSEAGSGFVVGTDGAGLTCQIQVQIPANGTPPPPDDTTPPVCGAIELEYVNGVLSAIVSSATDPESGIAEVRFTTTRNILGFVGPDAGSLMGPYSQGQTVSFDPETTSSIALRGERISMETGGAFVVRVTNGAGLSSNCDPVVAQLSSGAPESFSLEPAYPNPVRLGMQSVRIGFSVAEPGPVSVRVYDVVGREVMRLVEDNLEAGTYEVTWDGTDTSGRSVAAGVYIYRIEAGAFAQSQILTITR